MSSTRKIDREQFRYQTLETQIGIDSAVRDIDNFVESLDLEKLGFKVEKWSNTGRPAAADAKDLLKLFIYGAMNNIQSTRELERHCALNIEIIWLIYGQRPGHSIIANFRSENKACFAAVFEILADRILAWIGIGFQSLDGSKIRASNSKDANFTLSKIDDRIENLKKRIDEARRKAQKIDGTYELPEQPETKEYIPKSKKKKETQKTQGQLSLYEDDSTEKDKAEELEENLPDDDDDDDEDEDDDLSRLKKSIEERQDRLAKYLGYRDYMEKHNLSQLSLTDPDSKLMKSKNGYIVSYNVQMTVDSESQILSTICMTNNPTDMSLIYRTLKGLKARYPNQILHVTADKGYTVTEDMAECLENGIVPHVIMEDGTDFYTVQFPYEPCEVTEEKLQSEKTDDIKQCLRSGRIPQVYSKHLSNVVVKEKKIYDIDISGYRENMTEEEMKQLASCGFFVRDIARDRVYCPAKIILRRKSVKANDTVRYANKLGCAKCEARKQGYCTKSKFKEIDFPEKKTVKECQNWMPVEYVDVEEKPEGTETDEKKVVPGDEGESLESVKIREKENVEAGKKKAESEDGGSSSEDRKSEAKGSSDKGKTNEYKQIVKRKVVGTVVALSRSLKTALLHVNRLTMYTVTERYPGWYNAKKTPTYPRSLSDTDEGRSPHTMPRIAQKELYVNSKMTDDYIIYNPEWGSMHIDPVTNKMAQLYDHVKRSMKFSGGYQVWIYVPRYKLVNSGTLFRVLPPNLCPNKHYVVEEIQDVLDGSVEVILGSQEGEIKQAEENKKVESAEGENDRPCERTKWLWLLWFVKNVVLIEAVLRFIAYNSTISMPVSEGKIAAVIGYQDYLQDLRTNEPESWLKMVINAAWNIGRPLVPLRNCQSIESVLHYAKVTP